MSTTFVHPTPATVSPSTRGLNSPALPTFWQRLWAALEAHGQRRAAAHLRRMAAIHADIDPVLARRLYDAAEQRPQA